MLKLLQKLFSGGPYYIKIKPEWLWVKDVASGILYEDVPIIATTDTPKASVLAIGRHAEKEATSYAEKFTLQNGFDHPRTMIADFIIAERTLKHFIQKVHQNNIFRPSPIVILHPLDKLDGGLTSIEVRALQEMAMGAGAREAHIWVGRELTDHEIKSGKYPGDHWLPARPKWVKNQ